ncbi:DUF6197 family protein [Streptomyces roseolus]|uniref:DUF6197 family protein n=1 Tax=Streptomyces roseolus TaxID=67358 RepID=UPI0016759C37|nr:hypothetical protein [Streptomyces roseolus]GGR51498.1 hypothetical protein GCM10010282_50510 [Streptomyces roseolus]
MTPEEHLLAAADDMAKHGLGKRRYLADPTQWETTPACAYGTLARVSGDYTLMTLSDDTTEFARVGVDSESVETAARRLAKHLRAKFPDLFHGQWLNAHQVVTSYNDMPTTTAEDMILAFKEAAHHE